jgi:hypothetical protein
MKFNAFLLGVLFFVSTATGSAQVQPPLFSGDKNLEDRDVKTRSIDLERVDRDARKIDAQHSDPTAPNVYAGKFEQIKQDFENLQRLQNDIITSYKTSKTMDYSKISNNAEQMNKSGVRLEANLFPSAVEDTKKKKKSKEPAKLEVPVLEPMPADLKGTIVELDNTLAAFVSSPMFTNPQVVNQDENAKSHAKLQRIIALTAALKAQADKPVN